MSYLLYHFPFTPHRHIRSAPAHLLLLRRYIPFVLPSYSFLHDSSPLNTPLGLPLPHLFPSVSTSHVLIFYIRSYSTVSNVLSFVAAKTGYQNVDVPASEMPEFNPTGVVNGALTFTLFTPFAAPNLKAKGASGGPVLFRPGLNTKLIPGALLPPVNMTALDKTTPWQMSTRTTSGGSIVECEDAGCA
ncbi:hypothetical protein B0H13DRAFT_2414155 [Mycena leptocephala]|nr:hypothetical protein B0H13DRAFT_2414155 [Mycena leptocephala]